MYPDVYICEKNMFVYAYAQVPNADILCIIRVCTRIKLVIIHKNVVFYLNSSISYYYG